MDEKELRRFWNLCEYLWRRWNYGISTLSLHNGNWFYGDFRFVIERKKELNHIIYQSVSDGYWYLWYDWREKLLRDYGVPENLVIKSLWLV